MTPDFPKRKYPRADFLDYNIGDYFVTICTKNKLHYFGYIKDGEMHLSMVGQFLRDNIESTTIHFPEARVLNYVVMPNHVHLIVSIGDNENIPRQNKCVNRGKLNGAAALAVAAGRDPTMSTHHNTRLAVIVGSMKSATSRFAKRNDIEFGWQPRFHDHLIRGPHDGDNIWNYINNNVNNWEKDCFH